MIWLWLALLLGSLVFSCLQNRSLGIKIVEMQARFNAKNSELASVRVKHGQAWETFVPLMKQFDKELGDKNNAVFLGQPIDFIYFNKDEIIIVEVKTGSSRLSHNQKNIKRLVKEGKVRWVEVKDSLKSVSQDTAPSGKQH